MTIAELEKAAQDVENCRTVVDELGVRLTAKIRNIALTRALLAASWSLRAAHFALQVAQGVVDSQGVTQGTKGVSNER